jgi:hypothetical protein
MPFGFGSSNRKNTDSFTTNIKDREELSEITKIAEMLNPDEKVLLVAKQSRIKPGGSYMTPNIVYATDRRIIIRDPYMLGPPCQTNIENSSCKPVIVINPYRTRVQKIYCNRISGVKYIIIQLVV